MEKREGSHIFLQVARFLRRVLPVIVQAVHVLQRGRHQCFNRQIVQSRKVHRNIGAAHFFDVPLAVSSNAAQRAKMVMAFAPIAGFSVVAELALAGEQAKILWPQMTRIPHALFPAECAIALACPLIEINISFEGDGLAMAAAVIGVFHDVSLLRLNRVTPDHAVSSFGTGGRTYFGLSLRKGNSTR